MVNLQNGYLLCLGHLVFRYRHRFCGFLRRRQPHGHMKKVEQNRVLTTAHWEIFSKYVLSCILAGFNYPIVASTNTCYYSEFFCFLKSRIVTCQFFFRKKTFLFAVRFLRYSGYLTNTWRVINRDVLLLATIRYPEFPTLGVHNCLKLAI